MSSEAPTKALKTCLIPTQYTPTGVRGRLRSTIAPRRLSPP
jgi:hypothetical protein